MKSVLRTPRRWHEEAMRRLEEYLAQGGTKPLLAACTASGKTEFAIRVACNFFNDADGQLILLVAPTVNVKLRWVTDFRNAGFLATADIENREIRQRLEHGDPIKEDVEVIAVTYGQLASPQATTGDGWSLFAEYARRYRTLVIADEVHHADDAEAYGRAVTAVAAHATRRLALSGTPFNSTGGALAMCDVDLDVDITGQPVRRVKPFYTYSYGDALGDDDQPCRLVEFGVVYGRAELTYESLVTGQTFQRLIDLSRQRKEDSLAPLLAANGEYLTTLLSAGLAKLDMMKGRHQRAAMLVVAMDGDHGEMIRGELRRLCNNRYRIELLLHDTEQVHRRIEQLPHDDTDIVVTVRMISEGIDVQRFRVGVYASDYRTRMFFVQFIGRFLRWQKELDESQHAIVIIPGHVELVTYAREIEQMVLDSAIKEPGEGPGPLDPKSRLIDRESEATTQEHWARGQRTPESDQELVEQFFTENPDLRGWMSVSVAARILKATGYHGSTRSGSQTPPPGDPHLDWRRRNNKLAGRIVMRLSHRAGESRRSTELFAYVNGVANQRVGIRTMDGIVALDVLMRRVAFLKTWWLALLENHDAKLEDLPE